MAKVSEHPDAAQMLCPSVCFLARFHKNDLTDFNELFSKGVSWPDLQLVKVQCHSKVKNMLDIISDRIDIEREREREKT